MCNTVRGNSSVASLRDWVLKFYPHVVNVFVIIGLTLKHRHLCLMPLINFRVRKGLVYRCDNLINGTMTKYTARAHILVNTLVISADMVSHFQTSSGDMYCGVSGTLSTEHGRTATVPAGMSYLQVLVFIFFNETKRSINYKGLHNHYSPIERTACRKQIQIITLCGKVWNLNRLLFRHCPILFRINLNFRTITCADNSNVIRKSIPTLCIR